MLKEHSNGVGDFVAPHAPHAPEALRNLKGWLVWRIVRDPHNPRAKPRKIPISVEQDDGGGDRREIMA